MMIALVVLLALLNTARATLYTVGGDLGWIELSKNSIAYDDQFKDIALAVGDKLLFPFVEGPRNVYPVDSTHLAKCDGSSPIATYTTTNTVITLSEPGYWAKFAKFGTHCSQSGMHLAVNVSASNTASVHVPKTSSSGSSSGSRAPVSRRLASSMNFSKRSAPQRELASSNPSNPSTPSRLSPPLPPSPPQGPRTPRTPKAADAPNTPQTSYGVDSPPSAAAHSFALTPLAGLALLASATYLLILV